MALGATICKAHISIADVDRHFYEDVTLTIARHPSEKDERMMQRVLCYVLSAHEDLMFTKGLSTDDEPDLWQKNLVGDIEHWIELGQPDVRRIGKACGRAREVTVQCYSGHSAELWFRKLEPELNRFKNLKVKNVLPEESVALAQLAGRNMELNAYVSEQQVLFSNKDTSVQVNPQQWYPSES
ncbi:MAG: YaeQ family protein [Gammaproteobacteria bacterium]